MADQANRNIGREVRDTRSDKVWRVKRADKYQVLLEDDNGMQDFVSYTAFHRWLRYV